jgi:FkbM family methyltransferase
MILHADRSTAINRNAIRVLRRLGLLKHVIFDTRVSINGRTYTVPIIGGITEPLAFSRTTFKTDVLGLLERTVGARQFFDIGANDGSTMLEVLAWKAGLEYFGAEPNPSAFNILEKTARLNTLPATLFPWAFMNTTGPLKLYASSEIDTSATVVPGIRSGTYDRVEPRWVGSVKFDELRPELPLLSNFILKIDVEGAELEVLLGAQQSIHSLRPLIICEVLHAHSSAELRDSDRHKAAIESFLRTEKYTIYLCVLKRTEHTSRLSRLERLTTFPRALYRDAQDSCDYVFVPDEVALASLTPAT